MPCSVTSRFLLSLKLVPSMRNLRAGIVVDVAISLAGPESSCEDRLKHYNMRSTVYCSNKNLNKFVKMVPQRVIEREEMCKSRPF